MIRPSLLDTAPEHQTSPRKTQLPEIQDQKRPAQWFDEADTDYLNWTVTCDLQSR
jgi:hypothetical protein